MADPNSSGSSTALKRYGPVAVVVALVAAAILAFGGGGDDDKGAVTNPDRTKTRDGLPLTFQEAEADGIEGIDWGAGCDPDTGRVAVPLRNAAPCVEPWDDPDNGGATSPGVTADAIKVVVYQGEPDPLQQAIVDEAGADTDPADAAQAAVDYLEMLDDIYETYGRTLDIQVLEASGGPADATAAQADARTIIDMQPFAVLGGPAQTPVYWQEIVDAGILCVGGCSLAEGWAGAATSSTRSPSPTVPSDPSTRTACRFTVCKNESPSATWNFPPRTISRRRTRGLPPSRT